MANQTELDKLAADTSAMWLDEFDQQRAEYAQTKKPKADDWEEWGGVARPNKQLGAAADLALDTATQDELARRDPQFAKRLAEVRQEEVVTAFKAANPTYVANEKNQKTVYKFIRDNQLQDSNLDLDDVDDAAYEAGLWTPENLTAIFKHLASKGRLEMPAQIAKALNREEMLDVIACVRTGDLQGAVVAFIEYSFGGKLPHYSSARDLFSRYPRLASDASKFVYFHSVGTISQADWQAFEREKLANVPILTVRLIETAYNDWVVLRELNRDSKAADAVVSAPPPAEEEDLDSLSDEELNARIVQQQKAWRRNQ
jgi:hypothetical protein